MTPSAQSEGCPLNRGELRQLAALMRGRQITLRSREGTSWTAAIHSWERAWIGEGLSPDCALRSLLDAYEMGDDRP